MCTYKYAGNYMSIYKYIDSCRFIRFHSSPGRVPQNGPKHPTLSLLNYIELIITFSY